MKLHFQFDAAASTWEIKSQLGGVGSWPGIRSYELLERVSGEAPRYCVVVDVAEEQAQSLRDRVQGLAAQNAGYVSGLREIAYRLS